jgi:hypothetical protein
MKAGVVIALHQELRDSPENTPVTAKQLLTVLELIDDIIMRNAGEHESLHQLAITAFNAH